MTGLLPLETSFAAPRLQLGYRTATLAADGPLGRKNAAFRGHEFHYTRVIAMDDAEVSFAFRVERGFGVALLDYDNDGWLDVLVANGAVRLFDRDVLDTASPPESVPPESSATRTLDQPNQLFRNRGAADGEVSGGVTFDDVTARVKLEEQVLRQERLASLGLLAAGVAHEINTPLTGISSYTQMLLEEMRGDLADAEGEWIGLAKFSERGSDRVREAIESLIGTLL